MMQCPGLLAEVSENTPWSAERLSSEKQEQTSLVRKEEEPRIFLSNGEHWRGGAPGKIFEKEEENSCHGAARVGKKNPGRVIRFRSAVGFSSLLCMRFVL